MSFLDELKQQAAEVKAQENQVARQQAKRKHDFEQHVKPKAKKLFLYLHEMTKQLNTIKPDTQVSYQLKGIGTLKNMVQGNYILGKYDETNNRFFLRFTCKSRPLRFDVQNQQQAQQIHKYLWSHNIPFTDRQTNDARQVYLRTTFQLAGEIVVEFQYQANYETSAIDVTARNFEKLGREHYRFVPDDITDTFLDQYARYIIRQGDAEFMAEFSRDNPHRRGNLTQDQITREKIRLEIRRKQLEEQQRQTQELRARQAAARQQAGTDSEKRPSMVELATTPIPELLGGIFKKK